MHSEHATQRVTTARREQQPTDGASNDGLTLDPDIEPVAYLVESWNNMSESWEVTIRRSKPSRPSQSENPIRSVKPLVALPDAEHAPESIL